MLKDKVASAIKPGEHGTTFGGNPLACAAAVYTLNRIAEPKFLEQ
jgi:acetylornithine/succinyldiaminopimelate/putrescine aminotransferase